MSEGGSSVRKRSRPATEQARGSDEGFRDELAAERMAEMASGSGDGGSLATGMSDGAAACSERLGACGAGAHVAARFADMHDSACSARNETFAAAGALSGG